MKDRTEARTTAGDAVTEGVALVTGLGMVTIVLFPLALPAIVLAAAALIPLVVLALAVAVVSGVLAAPILAIRVVRRRKKDRPDGAVDPDRAASSSALRGAPSAKVVGS